MPAPAQEQPAVRNGQATLSASETKARAVQELKRMTAHLHMVRERLFLHLRTPFAGSLRLRCRSTLHAPLLHSRQRRWQHWKAGALQRGLRATPHPGRRRGRARRPRPCRKKRRPLRRPMQPVCLAGRSSPPSSSLPVVHKDVRPRCRLHIHLHAYICLRTFPNYQKTLHNNV